jgi:hypothetical protein
VIGAVAVCIGCVRVMLFKNIIVFFRVFEAMCYHKIVSVQGLHSYFLHFMFLYICLFIYLVMYYPLLWKIGMHREHHALCVCILLFQLFDQVTNFYGILCEHYATDGHVKFLCSE